MKIHDGKQRSFWALLLIILLAGALRAFRLGAQELRGDEAFSWNYVAHEPGPAALVERIVREGDPQPPIHYWVLQPWVRVFGDSEWAMRSLSAYLSLLLIPLVYQFATRAWNRRVGLLTAALTALHPYQVWLAQDVRNMYQLAIGSGLVATLLLPGLLRGRRAHWLGYTLFGALAMYSHYYALFGLIAHGAFVAISIRESNPKAHHEWLRWVAAGIAIALLVLPWAIVILPVYLGGQLADPARMPLLDFLSQTGADMALGPTIGDNVALAFLGVWLSVSVVGVVEQYRIAYSVLRKNAWYGIRNLALSEAEGTQYVPLLIAWPLVALVGIYAVVLTRATFNTFYFLVAFPATYTLFAGGLWQLARRRNWRPVAAVVAIVSLGLFGLALRNYYFGAEWSKDRGMRAVADTLNAYAQPGDVFIANFPDPAQAYYLRNISLPYHLQPPGPDFQPVATDSALTALAQEYDRLWFVPINAIQWDPEAYVETHLSDHYLRAAEFHFNKLRLQRFASDPTQAEGYRPIGIELTDGPTLTGAHIAVNGQPASKTVQPGDWLRVTLLWTATAPPSADYTVFVHALGADGLPVAQHDGPPHNGARPTSTWEIGETILDVHEFQLPEGVETATITVTVGMYLPETGERLTQIAGGGDNVVVGEFGVESSH